MPAQTPHLILDNEFLHPDKDPSSRPQLHPNSRTSFNLIIYVGPTIISNRQHELPKILVTVFYSDIISDWFHFVTQGPMDCPFRPMLAMEFRVKFHGVIPSTRFFRLA